MLKEPADIIQLEDLKCDTFIFDVGNVLLSWNTEDVITKAWPWCSEKEKYSQAIFYSHCWREFDRGQITEKDLIAHFSQLLNLPPAEMALLLETGKNSLLPIANGFALLNTLHQMGKTLYALSNMPKEMFVFLREKYQFWSKFSEIIISSEIKMVKPDAEIFAYLLETLNLNPKKIIFIDDSHHNIATSTSLGIPSVLFQGEFSAILENLYTAAF